MNITIVGAAKSGFSAAKLAKKQGHNVFLTESKSSESYKETIVKLDELGVGYEFGRNSDYGLNHCDLIVISPGVPPTAEILLKAEALRIPIISEVEYAFRFLKNPIIGITGTNGKTTTTTLTAFILNESGRKAVTAGNIGTPLCDLVGEIEDDTIIVAELSSFQLDRCVDFRPQVAMILNITPDHLYYHGTMEKYSQAKYKIFMQQFENNLLILNGEDSAIIQAASQARSDKAYFSMKPVSRGIYVEDGIIKIKMQQNTEDLMLVSELSLPGIHNVHNSMAAALAARAFEVRNENIRDCLMKFQGVEHRLEFVRALDEVDYVNDSKATNINATWFALTSYSRPLIWIAGGRGDSNNYAELDDIVEKNVRAIISIGEEKDAIFDHFCLTKRCIKAESLDHAVELARSEAEAGDIVLFTPACKSFDMFMNYEHRGEVYKEIVNKL